MSKRNRVARIEKFVVTLRQEGKTRQELLAILMATFKIANIVSAVTYMNGALQKNHMQYRLRKSPVKAVQA